MNGCFQLERVAKAQALKDDEACIGEGFSSSKVVLRAKHCLVMPLDCLRIIHEFFWGGGSADTFEFKL